MIKEVKINLQGIELGNNIPTFGGKIWQVVVKDLKDLTAKDEKQNVIEHRQGRIALAEGYTVKGIMPGETPDMMKVHTDRNTILDVPVTYANEKDVTTYMVFTDGATAKTIESHLNVEFTNENESRLTELFKEIDQLKAGKAFLKERITLNAATPDK